jgi:hypothetical protein
MSIDYVEESIKVIKECKDRDVLRLKSEMDNTAITFSTYVYYLTGSECRVAAESKGRV